jgi:glycosyltransferase involved in cell wall biosynthesis
MYNAEVPVVLGRAVGRSRGPLYVRTLHNTDCVGYRSKIVSSLLTRKFDYHIACGESVRIAYLGYTRKESDERVVAIPNGCELALRDTTPAERVAARERLAIAADKLVICHIGAYRGERLSNGQKAQDVLLNSFAGAFRGDSTALLVCAGDGPLRGDAETLAHELGIAAQTKFLGNIAEPWPLLKAADIFAMPSRHEGLSLALLEAASTGLPVIASDIPEIRSVCAGDGSILCPVDDVEAFSAAFLKVASDLPHYRLEAERGAVGVRTNYSIDACSQSYWNLFCKILANKLNADRSPVEEEASTSLGTTSVDCSTRKVT